MPTGFSVCLAGLLFACALAVLMLALARRWQHGAVLAGWTLSSLAVAGLAGGAFARGLGGLRSVKTLPEYISPYAVATASLLVLPGLVRRWLAWREARLLAEQAARLGAERTLLEARLAALQGQIEPHFLYNTLANVQYLLRHDAGRADHMLEQLIAYLRAALPELRQSETSLGQELARVRAYLDIMAIRMGDRLHYAIHCPPTMETAVLPPLAVATLVENALKHGLEAKPGGGRIDIVVGGDEAALQVEVRDDGLGFRETGQSGGVGLRNLGERLHTLFGEAGSLVLESNPDGGVIARLRLPLRLALAEEATA